MRPVPEEPSVTDAREDPGHGMAGPPGDPPGFRDAAEKGARGAPPDPGAAGLLAPPPGGLPRDHHALIRENGGFIPWCGPAALALATGRGLEEACGMLRAVAPQWYPRGGPIVTAYWRDLLAVLGQCGVPHATAPVAPGPRPTLLDLLRRGGPGGAALEPGWFLMRVTGHFLLVRSHGFGLGLAHDNHHSGTLVTARCLGRRRVTHAARLLGGPMLEQPPT